MEVLSEVIEASGASREIRYEFSDSDTSPEKVDHMHRLEPTIAGAAVVRTLTPLDLALNDYVTYTEPEEEDDGEAAEQADTGASTPDTADEDAGVDRMRTGTRALADDALRARSPIVHGRPPPTPVRQPTHSSHVSSRLTATEGDAEHLTGLQMELEKMMRTVLVGLRRVMMTQPSPTRPQDALSDDGDERRHESCHGQEAGHQEELEGVPTASPEQAAAMLSDLETSEAQLAERTTQFVEQTCLLALRRLNEKQPTAALRHLMRVEAMTLQGAGKTFRYVPEVSETRAVMSSMDSTRVAAAEEADEDDHADATRWQRQSTLSDATPHTLASTPGSASAAAWEVKLPFYATSMESARLKARATVLNNRGLYHYQMGEYDLAKQFLVEAVDMEEALRVPSIGITYFNLAEACWEQANQRQRGAHHRTDGDHPTTSTVNGSRRHSTPTASRGRAGDAIVAAHRSEALQYAAQAASATEQEVHRHQAVMDRLKHAFVLLQEEMALVGEARPDGEEEEDGVDAHDYRSGAEEGSVPQAAARAAHREVLQQELDATKRRTTLSWSRWREAIALLSHILAQNARWLREGGRQLHGAVHLYEQSLRWLSAVPNPTRDEQRRLERLRQVLQHCKREAREEKLNQKLYGIAATSNTTVRRSTSTSSATSPSPHMPPTRQSLTVLRNLASAKKAQQQAIHHPHHHIVTTMLPPRMEVMDPVVVARPTSRTSSGSAPAPTPPSSSAGSRGDRHRRARADSTRVNGAGYTHRGPLTSPHPATRSLPRANSMPSGRPRTSATAATGAARPAPAASSSASSNPSRHHTFSPYLPAPRRVPPQPQRAQRRVRPRTRYTDATVTTSSSPPPHPSTGMATAAGPDWGSHDAHRPHTASSGEPLRPPYYFNPPSYQRRMLSRAAHPAAVEEVCEADTDTASTASAVPAAYYYYWCESCQEWHHYHSSHAEDHATTAAAAPVAQDASAARPPSHRPPSPAVTKPDNTNNTSALSSVAVAAAPASSVSSASASAPPTSVTSSSAASVSHATCTTDASSASARPSTTHTPLPRKVSPPAHDRVSVEVVVLPPAPASPPSPPPPLAVVGQDEATQTEKVTEVSPAPLPLPTPAQTVTPAALESRTVTATTSSSTTVTAPPAAATTATPTLPVPVSTSAFLDVGFLSELIRRVVGEEAARSSALLAHPPPAPPAPSAPPAPLFASTTPASPWLASEYYSSAPPPFSAAPAEQTGSATSSTPLYCREPLPPAPLEATWPSGSEAVTTLQLDRTETAPSTHETVRPSEVHCGAEAPLGDNLLLPSAPIEAPPPPYHSALFDAAVFPNTPTLDIAHEHSHRPSIDTVPVSFGEPSALDDTTDTPAEERERASSTLQLPSRGRISAAERRPCASSHATPMRRLPESSQSTTDAAPVQANETDDAPSWNQSPCSAIEASSDAGAVHDVSMLDEEREEESAGVAQAIAPHTSPPAPPVFDEAEEEEEEDDDRTEEKADEAAEEETTEEKVDAMPEGYLNEPAPEPVKVCALDERAMTVDVKDVREAQTPLYHTETVAGWEVNTSGPLDTRFAVDATGMTPRTPEEATDLPRPTHDHTELTSSNGTLTIEKSGSTCAPEASRTSTPPPPPLTHVDTHTPHRSDEKTIESVVGTPYTLSSQASPTHQLGDTHSEAVTPDRDGAAVGAAKALDWHARAPTARVPALSEAVNTSAPAISAAVRSLLSETPPSPLYLQDHTAAMVTTLSLDDTTTTTTRVTDSRVVPEEDDRTHMSALADHAPHETSTAGQQLTTPVEGRLPPPPPPPLPHPHPPHADPGPAVLPHSPPRRLSTSSSSSTLLSSNARVFAYTSGKGVRNRAKLRQYLSHDPSDTAPVDAPVVAPELESAPGTRPPSPCDSGLQRPRSHGPPEGSTSSSRTPHTGSTGHLTAEDYGIVVPSPNYAFLATTVGPGRLEAPGDLFTTPSDTSVTRVLALPRLFSGTPSALEAKDLGVAATVSSVMGGSSATTVSTSPTSEATRTVPAPAPAPSPSPPPPSPPVPSAVTTALEKQQRWQAHLTTREGILREEAAKLIQSTYLEWRTHRA